MAEFKLGRIKFVWKGTWQASDSYYKDDVVSYGGNTYVCVAGHTSSTFDADLLAKWEQMSGGFDWQGAWLSGTLYKQGDIVKYGGNTYVCVSGHTASSGITPANISYWEVYTNGVSWKGDWTPSAPYFINDLVKYNSNVYITTTSHVAAATFDLTKFNQFVLGLEFVDSWNSATSYVVGEIVTYGGYSYVAQTNNNNSTPSPTSSDWDVVTTGFNVQGAWNASTVYKTGDVVQFGGWAYVASVNSQNQRPYVSTTGVNAGYWTVVVKGLQPNGAYNENTLYGPGDIVEVGGTSYIATATTSGVTPPNATFWQLMAQGSIGASLTARGDIAYREATGAVIGLHMQNGTYSASAVQEGYVLKARKILSPSTGLEPRWEEYGYTTNVWYVSLLGTDDVSNGYGRTLDRPFRTIKYATLQAASGSTIFVKTGTYAEQLPIRIPANVSIVGDELRTTIITPASGTSDDSITPNNRSRMFLMNNATVLRNFTLSGLVGDFTVDGTYVASAFTTVKRLTTGWPSLTASGCYVSLDPTGNISSKSPYIQNCTAIGTKAIGVLIDGSVQSGGYKSMVMNDFTQVIDDGIGVWAINGGRAELVSVFTYYNYIGYLAELGGILRALNGNNSYGTIGSFSCDIDPTDSGFSGLVNNYNNEAKIGKVWVGEGRIFAIGWNYGGQGYSTATISLDSAPLNGTNASVSPVFGDGVLSHVTLTSGGSGYQYITGTARQGGTNNNGTWLALAATDKMTTANQYLGMRITILNGAGSGQTGIISASMLIDGVSAFNKVVYVTTTSGTPGWETLSGSTIITALDASTQYDIVPEVTVVGGTPTATAVVRPIIDPSTFVMTAVYILDGGVGYTGTPTFTITDPQNTAEAVLVPQILNGAIRTVTYGNRGTGYTVATGTVTGDGFANIAQTGSSLAFSGFSKAPRPGAIITIAGQTGNFLVIQTTNISLETQGEGYADDKYTVTVSTPVSSTNPLVHGNAVTVYEKFSQIRLTGHDFLAIGSGNFASTAYPSVSTETYRKYREKITANNGRVFYVSTDQDGNLSVGDLFQVNQATGQATLNVTSFNLSGLNSLQLQTGVSISQFSADATLSANSDSIVPTQKAIRTYISSQLGSGSNNLQVNVLQAGKIYIQNNVISTFTGTNSDLSLAADGTGIIKLANTTTYDYSRTSIKSLSSTSVVNRQYVDEETRATVHAVMLDDNGNLTYTYDVGDDTATTLDGSAYTDYFVGSRNASVALSTAGNLQITY